MDSRYFRPAAIRHASIDILNGFQWIFENVSDSDILWMIFEYFL